MNEATLYEHEDGRHAIAPGTESPAFTRGDPKWHRVGPVDVSALHAGVAAAEPHTDDLAVDRFAAAMKEKMTKQRAKGYGGWDKQGECSADFLQAALFRHVAKGDPVDVGNFAMMLFCRGERTQYEDQWVYDLAGKWPGLAALTSATAVPEATMFWNDADPERSADSIHEVIEREWSDGLLQIGDVLEIQRAARMSNIKVELIPDPANEDSFDYVVMPEKTAELKGVQPGERGEG